MGWLNRYQCHNGLSVHDENDDEISVPLTWKKSNQVTILHCHDSRTIIACARLWPDSITRIKLKQKDFQRILVRRSYIISEICPRWLNILKYSFQSYRQTSNISNTLVSNNIVDHSDVVGTSPVGAAPTTSSFSTSHLASMYWVYTARRDDNYSNFGFGVAYIRDFMVHR